MPIFQIPSSKLLESHPGIDRWIAILLGAIMLFPSKIDIDKHVHYQARCLVSSMPRFMEHIDGSVLNAGEVLYGFVMNTFGSWAKFDYALFCTSFKEDGKWALQERIKHGYLAGALFRAAYYHDVSLREATSLLPELIEGRKDILEVVGYPSESNLLNNIWPKFKDAAWLWASLFAFSMPDEPDSYFQLDKAVPSPEYAETQVSSGLMGVIGIANDYFEQAILQGKKSKKSRTKLVNPETAWKIELV